MVFEANSGQLHPDVVFYARAFPTTLFLTRREAVLSLNGSVLRIGLKDSNPAPEVEGQEPAKATTDYFIGRDAASWRKRVVNYQRVRYREVYPGIDLIYYGRGREVEYDFVVAPGADPARIRVSFSGADRVSIAEDGSLRIGVGGAELKQPKPVVFQRGQSGELERIAGGYRLTGKREVAFALSDYDRSRELVIDPVLSVATYLGGRSTDVAKAIAVDADGSIWVTGYTHSASFPTAGEPVKDTRVGQRDIFLTKLSRTLKGPDAVLYSTYLGGTADDEPNAIAVDPNGGVYVVGSTSSTDFPVVGSPFQATSGGGIDGFLIKLHLAERGDGAIWYSSYIGGSLSDAANAVAVDQSGRIYMAGMTASSDFPVTSDSLQPATGGGYDAFVTLIDPQTAGMDGLVYSTYLGGSNTESATCLALLYEYQVFVGGNTFSTNFPVTADAASWTYLGGGDAFLARLDLTQAEGEGLKHATYIGGTGPDAANGIAVAEGYVYLSGYTLSGDLPTTPNAAQQQNAGGTDVFLAKFDVERPVREGLAYLTYFGGSDGDIGTGMAADPSGQVYITGYTYSSDFPLKDKPIQPVLRGGVDAFLVRLDTNAFGAQSLGYSTYIGGGSVDYGFGLALHPDGEVFVGGVTQSTDLPVPGDAVQAQPSSLVDAFIVGITQCRVMLSGSGESFGAGGGEGEILVTADAGCEWAAASDAEWLLVNGSSGSGNGSLRFQVASNSLSSTRRGTITVSGQSYVVTQEGMACSYTLEASGVTIGPMEELRSVALSASGADCRWSAISGADWLSIAAGAEGVGNGIVIFSAASNPYEPARTGTVVIAGQDFTVTQLGLERPALTLSPSLLTYTAGGGAPLTAVLPLEVQSSAARPFMAIPVMVSGGNWLSISSSVGVAPATMQVTINAAGLTPGNYSAAIIVLATDQPAMAFLVPVNLTVL